MMMMMMISQGKCDGTIENTEEIPNTPNMRLGSKVKHDSSSSMGEREERVQIERIW